LECDRYHKWERGDNNWSSFTHLNPNANYIEKMKEDVFNLKIGKEIYQVDYDHTTGKFTEKQLINPSNNLIVCGLHSFYTDSNSLYDLKIYMDTNDKLKKKWKIIRDVNERGHNINKVLNSIDRRYEDYVNFILPQKNNADIVVKFFSTNEIDLNDLTTNDNLGLELSILNKFNVNKILYKLDQHNIIYGMSDDGEFSKLTFTNYVNSEIFNYNIPKEYHKFYNYILFFILNLTLHIDK
jgi:uridine kinase